MKMSDIKLLSEVDLERKITEAYKEATEISMQAITNELKDTSKIRKNQKHTARLLTAKQVFKGGKDGK